MKRQVITIQEDMVIYAPHHGEVWMTVWEIAELLNITGTAVKNTIKRIWKQSVLKDFQHSQYIKLENGYSAHVYDMEVTSEHDIPLIVKRIVEAGGDLYHVSEQQLSLEEIYFSLIDREHAETERENT